MTNKKNSTVIEPNPLRRKLVHSAWVAPVVLAVNLPAHAQTSVVSGSMSYTEPGEFEFAVPEGVNSLNIEAYGANGGDGGSHIRISSDINNVGGAGGLGGGVNTNLSVTSGETLTITVGEKGNDGMNSPATSGGSGGFGYNSGGDGSIPTLGNNNGGGGGGGGGSTAVVGTMSTVIAGGGGGGGGGLQAVQLNDPSGEGGDGGGSGTDGGDLPAIINPNGGLAGGGNPMAPTVESTGIGGGGGGLSSGDAGGFITLNGTIYGGTGGGGGTGTTGSTNGTNPNSSGNGSVILTW